MSKFNSLSEAEQEIAKEMIYDGDVISYDCFTKSDNPEIEIEQYVVATAEDPESEYHITLWNDEPVYFKRYKAQ